MNYYSFLAGSEEYVDLGAQWLHGDEGNPLYDALSQKDLISHSGDFLSFWPVTDGMFWLKEVLSVYLIESSY